MNIRDQYCPNANCRFHLLKLSGNIVIHSRVQSRFRCNHCYKTWVAHRNKMHFGLKSGERKVMVTGYLLKEQGMTIRKAAETLRVSPSTILRFKRRIENFAFSLDFC